MKFQKTIYQQVRAHMRNLALKLFAAVIISPLILALILSAILITVAIFEGKPITNISSTEFIYFLGLVYMYGLAGAFFIGLPVYLLLKRYSYISYKYLLYSGFIGGWVMLSIISVLDNDLPNFTSIVLFGVLGAIVSSCFWLSVVYVPHKLLKRKNESKL